MTTRADKINTIIASRKPHVEKTAKTIEQLRQLERERVKICLASFRRNGLDWNAGVPPACQPIDVAQNE